MRPRASRTTSEKDFRKQKLLQAAALDDNRDGKELFLYYGEKFMF